MEDSGSTSELGASGGSNVTVDSDLTAPVYDRSDVALTNRTTEEDRAALEKTVDMLIGEGYAVQIPDEGTPVDRPPPQLGTVSEEFSSEWKEEQDVLRKKDEEERAERRKVSNRDGERREREGGCMFV